MFDVFGEFDSAMEINMAAEGLKEEGDLDSLRKLAEENGLSDYVDAYIAGDMDELCDVMTAAIGKLQVEMGEAAGWRAMAEDIVGYLESNCDDLAFAEAVRKKGKRISLAALEIEREARNNKVSIPGGASCNFCGPMRGYQLIREYYKGGGKR